MAFREAVPFLIIAILATLVLAFVHPYLAIFGIIAFLYILYFFRDPKREVPNDPDAIVSAADGVVIRVDEVDTAPITGQRMKRVAVFLSVFNVHVNRAPYEGQIQKIEHRAGKFLDARVPDVDLRNEHQNWLIETPRGNIVVQQIAGLIARRIVAWKKVSKEVTKGERIGMIRFGSRTDVYLPFDCDIQVKIGQRVQGCSTILARWKN